MTTGKGGRQPVDLGVTGARVAVRLKEIRESITPHLSLRQLAKRLEDIGHPISGDGLSRIEIGKRKVDVDDLMALALALDVSPLALLLPLTASPDEKVELTPNRSVTGRAAWDWARANTPLEVPEDDDGRAMWVLQERNLPLWARGVTSSMVNSPYGQRRVQEWERLLPDGWKEKMRAADNEDPD